MLIPKGEALLDIDPFAIYNSFSDGLSVTLS